MAKGWLKKSHKIRERRSRRRSVLRQVLTLTMAFWLIKIWTQQPRKDVPKRAIGMFLQLGQWQPKVHGEHIMQCLDSLIDASQVDNFLLTVFLSVTPELYRDSALISKFSYKLPKGCLHILPVVDEGFDVGPFLKQLSHFDEVGQQDFLIKIHSKSDPIWLERSVQSLCGTPSQVSSVLRAFKLQPDTDMVAPMGVTFNPTTSKDALFPHLIRKYYSSDELGAAFDDATVARMMHLCSMMGEGCPKFEEHLMAVVAGTMFWARNSDIFTSHLPLLLPRIAKLFTKTYSANSKYEHALERLIPSLIRFKGKQIYQIQPAPKPIALNFLGHIL